MEALASRFGGFVRNIDEADWRHVSAEDGKVPEYTAKDRLRIALESSVGSAAVAAFAPFMDDAGKLAAAARALTDYADEVSAPSITP